MGAVHKREWNHVMHRLRALGGLFAISMVCLVGCGHGVGGPPVTIPRSPSHSTATSTTSATTHPTKSSTTVPPARSTTTTTVPPAPAALVPLVTPALAGEGQWTAAGRSVGGAPVLYITTLGLPVRAPRPGSPGWTPTVCAATSIRAASA